MPESTTWDVAVTFVCSDNAQSNRVKSALTMRGDKSQTELLLADSPEDVRVLQKVTVSVEAADELAADQLVRDRYAQLIELAEDVEVEIQLPEPEVDDSDLEAIQDAEDMQALLESMGPELLEIARERGFPTSYDDHLDGIIGSDDSDPLMPGEEPDPLSPDVLGQDARQADPGPAVALTRHEADEAVKMQIAALVVGGLNAQDANGKQWHLWEVARSLGIDHLVKGILSAQGYGPVDFDDVDLMGTVD
jgi:hypothetical protein